MGLACRRVGNNSTYSLRILDRPQQALATGFRSIDFITAGRELTGDCTVVPPTRGDVNIKEQLILSLR
jgi:hypothetical protein